MSTSKASHCIYRQMISFCRWCFLLKILLLAYAKTSESSNYLSNQRCIYRKICLIMCEDSKAIVVVVPQDQCCHCNLPSLRAVKPSFFRCSQRETFMICKLLAQKSKTSWFVFVLNVHGIAPQEFTLDNKQILRCFVLLFPPSQILFFPQKRIFRKPPTWMLLQLHF